MFKRYHAFLKNAIQTYLKITIKIKIKMKHIFLFFALTIFSSLGLQAQNDAISRYFDQYVEDDRFTMVYISPKMFQILGKLDLEELNEPEASAIMEVVTDLKGLRVLTTEVSPMKFYKEAKDKLPTGNYDLLLRVRDENQNVHIYTQGKGTDSFEELLILVGGEDEFVLVSFDGKIDLNKISKLANTLDMKGVKHLNKIDSEAKKKQKE